jgi:hypothetical protein
MVRRFACLVAFVAVIASAFTRGQQPLDPPAAPIAVPTMSAGDAPAFVEAADRQLD